MNRNPQKLEQTTTRKQNQKGQEQRERAEAEDGKILWKPPAPEKTPQQRLSSPEGIAKNVTVISAFLKPLSSTSLSIDASAATTSKRRTQPGSWDQASASRQPAKCQKTPRTASAGHRATGEETTHSPLHFFLSRPGHSLLTERPHAILSTLSH